MKRLYSLFEKRGHRYHRLSPLSYLRDVAIHVFQDHLLQGATTGRTLALRPVDDSWNGNQRVYRPPVEQFEAIKRPNRLEEEAMVVTPLKIGERHVIRAQARTYSTKGGQK